MKTTMKKSVARIITLAIVLVMMVSLTVSAMAATLPAASGLDDVKHGVFKFNMKIDLPGKGGWVSSRGTAFLINDDHIITAAHCVRFTEWEANYYEHTLSDELAKLGVMKAEPSYSVTVERDLTVGATLVNYSEEMDFAILKLDQKIPTRKYLTLRDSKEMKAGDRVFTVGFPAFNDNEDSDYTIADVTVKDGGITKIQHDKTDKYASGQPLQLDVLDTSVPISGGDSGGPMVDDNGYVIGISIAHIGSDNEANYYASAIDQVMRACDNLGIEYYTNEVAPEPTEVSATEAPATEAPTETPTEAPATEAPATEAPVPETTAPVVIEEKDEGGMNTILIVAAVAVIAVIVIIVIVMSKGKKTAPAAAAPAAAPAAPTAPTGGFTAPAYTAPMGAGETTVLGGDAGETTILNRSANGGNLIRKRTNETITINAERFIIGRERKTANYCISDNSSISRSHVTLTVKNGTTYLTDMNAANGTYVNGVKVLPNQEVALKAGDKIKLSDEEFEFRV